MTATLGYSFSDGEKALPGQQTFTKQDKGGARRSVALSVKGEKASGEGDEVKR